MRSESRIGFGMRLVSVYKMQTRGGRFGEKWTSAAANCMSYNGFKGTSNSHGRRVLTRSLLGSAAREQPGNY